MRFVVFDIETANTFPTLTRGDLTRLDLALVGIYDSESDTYSSYVREELSKLWPILERADLLIGFNSDTFDIPLLNRYYPGELTHIRSLDLLSEIYKSLGRRIRLQSLAEGTLGRGKSGNGLKAVEWWQKGEVEKVREYCLEDVRLTKELFDYAREHKSLKYRDLRDIREIKLDISNWNGNGDGAALTHTLPL